MAEYIDREVLLSKLGFEKHRKKDVLSGSTFDIVLKVPATDLVPVIHGKWIPVWFYGDYRELGDRPSAYKCSNCSDFVAIKPTCGYNYCPSCGAKMEENK